MKPGRILLVADDDLVSREIVRGVLSNDFEEVVDASNGLEARDILVERGSAIDLVVLDLHMPLLDGVSLLRELRERGLAVPVLVCSASSDLKDAVEAMKMGAKDYFEKPFETEIIRSRVRAILTEKQLRTDNDSLRRELERRRAPISLVGTSSGISDVLLSIAKVARSTCTVLIRGETGTGKEMAARAVHEVGPRRGEPYQVIDCASLSASLVESELFGHEKGAFTGAQARRTGLFQSAGKGTVFLDEVGELPLEIQAKLLRVLQERQNRPIGGSAYFPFEARLVAATNRVQSERNPPLRRVRPAGFDHRPEDGGEGVHRGSRTVRQHPRSERRRIGRLPDFRAFWPDLRGRARRGGIVHLVGRGQ
jgi:DNA-binding NtrC family response regulator